VIERHGVKGTIADDVFFSERAVSGGQVVAHIRVEISRQNGNLGHIKQKMAAQATAAGATVIANFRYGQRSHRGLRLLMPKWDTESWYGEGDALAGPFAGE
jgi:hypothetical protein